MRFYYDYDSTRAYEQGKRDEDYSKRDYNYDRYSDRERDRAYFEGHLDREREIMERREEERRQEEMEERRAHQRMLDRRAEQEYYEEEQYRQQQEMEQPEYPEPPSPFSGSPEDENVNTHKNQDSTKSTT